MAAMKPLSCPECGVPVGPPISFLMTSDLDHVAVTLQLANGKDITTAFSQHMATHIYDALGDRLFGTDPPAASPGDPQ